MSAAFCQLPQALLSLVHSTFPCRETQIRALATLVYPHAAPCRNLIIHGTESTGKSAITTAVLSQLARDGEATLRYAIVSSPECVTARQLFERTTGSVADALQWTAKVGSCETLASLMVELSKMLKYVERGPGFRFVLVFDGIDRQREAPPTLLPALARLSEIIPNLTVVFILTRPSQLLLRAPAAAHLNFPPYTKSQYCAILSRKPPASLPNATQQETDDLYARFVTAVYDSLARPAGRTLPALQRACTALWPRFTAPVAAGTHRAREFSKLLVAARTHLQDEAVLEPDLVSPSSTRPGKATVTRGSAPDLSALLPPTARLLLVAAYLASHNSPKHDQTLLSTWHHGRRRRGGGISSSLATRNTDRRSKHRKIARRLLGPGVFVLERMVAIYSAIRTQCVGEKGLSGGVDADVGMAIATLASLRLIGRSGGSVAGGGDMDRGGKWRVGVGWEIIRGVGRSLGVEVEEWLIE